jgi:hypothetical protein
MCPVIKEKKCKEPEAGGLMPETARSNDIGNKRYPKTGFVLDEEHHYYYWNVD